MAKKHKSEAQTEAATDKVAESSPIDWHAPFNEALRDELIDYEQYLTFESEHTLTTGSLQIDVLVIKNPAEIPINKNIGKIFKKINIFEYKSPSDNLSLVDFERVHAYAWLYTTLHGSETDATDITLSFVVYHYPREILKFCNKRRPTTVTETSSGVYVVEGADFPIQFIVVPKVDAEVNFTLDKLRNNLKAVDIVKLIQYAAENERMRAIVTAVVKANRDILKGDIDMTLLPPEFIAKLDEAGLTKDIRAKSRQEGVNVGVDRTLDTYSALLREEGISPEVLQRVQARVKQQTLSELTPV
jgi:hypothetical protein